MATVQKTFSWILRVLTAAGGLCVVNLLPAADGTGQLSQAVAGCEAGLRFEDRGDGTVRDCNTQLLWLKDAHCFGLMNWSAATAAASALADGVCGLADGSAAGDWRLPGIGEFCSAPVGGRAAAVCPASAAQNSLINMRFLNPALSDATGTRPWRDGDPFDGPLAIPYWSSTEDAHIDAAAWAAHVGTGLMGATGKLFSQYLWPVRSVDVNL